MSEVGFQAINYKTSFGNQKGPKPVVQNNIKSQGNSQNPQKTKRGLVGANIADGVTGVASLGAFALIRNWLKPVYKAKSFKNNSVNDLFNLVFKVGKNPPILCAALAAGAVGGIVKPLIMSCNDLLSGKYKDEKYQDKSSIKKGLYFVGNSIRNGFSGAITGLMTPIVSSLGIIGAPVYFALNSLNNYFIGTKGWQDKDKNIESFINNFRESKISGTLASAAILVPAIIKGHGFKKFDKNLETAFANLNNANLKIPSGGEKTTYSEISDVVLGNKKISKIINSRKNVSKKIEKLSKENIFVLKFKQIEGNEDELSKALKKSCPASRKLKDAQKIINKQFSGEYEIESLAGVGTVAESYLVKDKSGKEFCIKLLKKGINKKKIEKDKKAIIKMINKMYGKNTDKAKFLISNFEDIADGVIKEVDFNQEMKAAQELAKVTKQAMLVQPVKVSKDGSAYVMEKAKGVCLQDLTMSDYDIFTGGSKKLKELNITKDETLKMFDRYCDVTVEQFNKVNSDGKIIHGDIHPGNIFVDVEAMRRGEKNFLTLIDTGNTVVQTPDMAQRYVRLTKYIRNGDVDNITQFVLEGAKLPNGMTKEKAYEEVSKKLKKYFFDNETHIGALNNNKVINLTDRIMSELKIIPNSTQGNLLKASTSAKNSMVEFIKNALSKIVEEAKDEKNGAKGIYDTSGMLLKFCKKEIVQDLKNIFTNLGSYFKFKKGKDIPDGNSVEYLTYKLKQQLKTPNKNNI